MSILNYLGPGGGALGEWCGGAKPPSKLLLFFFKFLQIKKYKVDHILKIKICTKKSFMQKNERQVNSNLFCKFGHFWRKLNFWASKRGVLGAQKFNFLQKRPNLQERLELTWRSSSQEFLFFCAILIFWDIFTSSNYCVQISQEFFLCVLGHVFLKRCKMLWSEL